MEIDWPVERFGGEREIYFELEHEVLGSRIVVVVVVVEREIPLWFEWKMAAVVAEKIVGSSSLVELVLEDRVASADSAAVVDKLHN